MSNRTELLESLIRFERPLPIVIEQLTQFSWDSEYSYAILSRQAIIAILNRFISGQLTALDVCEWAEEMEGRIASDLERELGYGELINNVLNFLTTDQRAGYVLTPEDARREIIRLTNTSPDINDEFIRPFHPPQGSY